MAENEEVVYVGSKPPMNYVLAVMTSLSKGDADRVSLKARGRAISTAVDVAEISSRRFAKDLEVDTIDIGTEEMPPREGENNPRNVSTIEIVLARH